MLIIDGTSVYEIDEECVEKQGVPDSCELPISKKEDVERGSVKELKSVNQKKEKDHGRN